MVELNVFATINIELIKRKSIDTNIETVHIKIIY